jgi:DNA polymerase III subunit delta'
MDIIGHSKQRDLLKKSISSDKLAHAYIFYGPADIGKKVVALELAELIEGDVTMIQAEDQTVSIDQIKVLKDKFRLTSDDYKVAIIDNATSMTTDAQNALLKLLEEPKGRTVIALIADSQDKLLSTIVSRSISLRFDMPSFSEIEKHLVSKGVDKERAEELSWLSFQRPGRAVYFVEHSEEFELEKIKDIQELIDSPLNVKFKYAEKLSKDKNELDKTLDIWLNYFRQILFDITGVKAMPKKFVTKTYTTEQVRRIMELIEKIEQVIKNTNVNPRLALETLFLKI